jgi:DeoR/GlpR family transcriptional regulator of sugar metabolism
LALVPVKRKEEILDFIRDKKICSIAELARRFSVSRVTIHRVLNELESEDLVTKVHGGVRAAQQPQGRIETRFSVRMEINKAKKIEIAKKARQFVRDRDSIYIDSSTTCFQFARLLGAESSLHLTVISNSPLISCELSDARHLNIISTGGDLFQEVYSFAGDLTLEAIQKLQFEKVFLSAPALSVEQGLMTSQSFLALIKRKVIAKASEVNLLVDSSKFDRIAPRVIAPIERVTRIITDSGLPDELRKKYGKLGIELVM